MWAGSWRPPTLPWFWWRKVQMTTSQHQSTRSLHLQVYIGHSLYTVTAIYRHSPIYCHNSIYGITFKHFRALCLEGASFCCFALYAPMNYKLFNNEKIVWGSKRPKCFNWQYLRQRPINDKHVLRGTFFQDMIVKTPLQHTSCSNTKNGRPFARHVVFRAVWDKMRLLWVSRAALNSFSHESKACSFLVWSRIIESQCFDLSAGRAARPAHRPMAVMETLTYWCPQRWLTRLRMTVTFSVLDGFLQKKA